jgi:hypothetical protein
MRDVVAYHLRLLQGFFQQRRAHRSSYVPAYPPVTEETSFRIKQWLAARGNVDIGTVPAGGSVPEVAKWLVRVDIEILLPPPLKLFDRMDNVGSMNLEVPILLRMKIENTCPISCKGYWQTQGKLRHSGEGVVDAHVPWELGDDRKGGCWVSRAQSVRQRGAVTA